MYGHHMDVSHVDESDDGRIGLSFDGTVRRNKHYGDLEFFALLCCSVCFGICVVGCGVYKVT